MKRILLAALFLLAFPILSFAEEIGLGWNATTDNVGVTKYTVYWGTASRDYDNSIDVGLDLTATVTGLVIGTTYYFTVTASDAAENESDYGNEVFYLTTDIIAPDGVITLKIIKITP